MTCPNCHASNPDNARFCGQCYVSFATLAAPPDEVTSQTLAPQADSGAPVRAGDTPADVTSADLTSADLTAESPPPRDAAVGRFTSVDGQMVWTCAVCSTTNPVQQYSCEVCGARMDAEVGQGDTAQVDWAGARRAELMFPGLGHLRTDQAGVGAARMGIAVLWLLGAIVLALGGTAGVVTSLPLLIGLGILWATGPGDVEAARTSRPPRLDGRQFMYLVIGVTVGVIVAGGVSLIL